MSNHPNLESKGKDVDGLCFLIIEPISFPFDLIRTSLFWLSFWCLLGLFDMFSFHMVFWVVVFWFLLDFVRSCPYEIVGYGFTIMVYGCMCFDWMYLVGMSRLEVV